MHSSPAAEHGAQSAIYALQSKTVIAAFPPNFFGSPYSGSWSQAVTLPDARVASAELFVTNRRGNSPVRSICLTTAVDKGLRTLSGGQYSIQVDGYLAVEEQVAPALVVEAGHSVRDVLAVLGTAADAEVRLRVDMDGAGILHPIDSSGNDDVGGYRWERHGTAGGGRQADASGNGGRTDLSGREPDSSNSTLMAEQLTKLRPDRDLQCYFERPSAIAALSGASIDGFTVSGCWRQQFDWVVIEWNRDNVFEHPALRNLPDGDLSGLQLSYEEVRTNCIPLDSTLYPTVDWPYLRIWAEAGGVETLYKVPLKDHATALGAYEDARADFELQGTPTAGDYIELAWLDQHYNYRLTASDTLESAASALATAITANQAVGAVSATASGARIVLTYHGAPGSNGNRIGVYGTVHGAGTESWAPAAATFAGGVSPERWRVQLDFSALRDAAGVTVPTHAVRKMRWTWAADLQSGNFERSEFEVAVTNWQVSGKNLLYTVAGTGSRRIEDDAAVTYEGHWVEDRGNYSGGSIRWSDTSGSRVSCTYSANGKHWLYLGTRLLDHGGQVSVQIDGCTPVTLGLGKPAEDVLVRLPIAEISGQAQHTVTITHTGANGTVVYFDFLEIAYPSYALPEFERNAQTTLATDWDTDHSLAIAPERTAWLMQKLGFFGRANHYAGAMWFYELQRVGHSYASGTLTFSGRA